MSFEKREAHSFIVTVALDERALEYIKSFKGLAGIPDEFCKGVIEGALKRESAEFSLDHDISVDFKVRKEQVTYTEPW